MIKGENIHEELEHSLPAVYICSRYRPKSADPEKQKMELKQNIERAKQGSYFAALFPREMKVSRLPIRPRKLFIRVSSPANRAGVSLASMRTKHCPARAVRTAWSSTA